MQPGRLHQSDSDISGLRLHGICRDDVVTDTTQFKTQPITPDFLLSQLRVAIVAVLAYGGGAHWFTPEAAGLYLTLFSTLGPLAIPWGWSIVSNFGSTKVYTGSAAAVVAQVEAVDVTAAKVGAINALISNKDNPNTPNVKS
jgi:hypothetical protein